MKIAHTVVFDSSYFENLEHGFPKISCEARRCHVDYLLQFHMTLIVLYIYLKEVPWSFDHARLIPLEKQFKNMLLCTKCTSMKRNKNIYLLCR